MPEEEEETSETEGSETEEDSDRTEEGVEGQEEASEIEDSKAEEDTQDRDSPLQEPLAEEDKVKSLNKDQPRTLHSMDSPDSATHADLTAISWQHVQKG